MDAMIPTAVVESVVGRVTVIVPVSDRHDNLVSLHRDYRTAVASCCSDVQFIYVLDGPQQPALQMLKSLRAEGEALQILQLGKCFGEAAALSAGFSRASGEWIFTLPAYYQVTPDSLQRLFEARDANYMVIARREKRSDPLLNRLMGRAFNAIVSSMTGTHFSDLGCGARMFRRAVLEEIALYGDQHRFLPVLASMRGFSVAEVPLPQAPQDRTRRQHGPGALIRRLLDLVSVFFLAKFTKKPLRFFGLIGSGIASVGALWIGALVIQKLVFLQPLADRPALILASLLLVLGVQVFALGLVGEIIIFTHARDIREYVVEEVV